MFDGIAENEVAERDCFYMKLLIFLFVSFISV